MKNINRTYYGYLQNRKIQSIEDEMDKALKKFNDLCWIMIDKSTETFEIMPSLNRLLNMFENYIINTPISNE